LSIFLEHFGGFTTSIIYHPGPILEQYVTPTAWHDIHDPPHFYYMYHLWANISQLNTLRIAKNKKKFLFKPLANNHEDLLPCYLLADSILNGISLEKSPVLQYLFVLDKIGVAMNPMGDDATIAPYSSHPFNKFLKRGLAVSLSTYAPIHLHMIREPLSEEYGVASQIWKLSDSALSEVARNSVINSSFNVEELLGEDLNDENLTNVPDIRLKYREETQNTQIEYIEEVVRDFESRKISQI